MKVIAVLLALCILDPATAAPLKILKRWHGKSAVSRSAVVNPTQAPSVGTHNEVVGDDVLGKMEKVIKKTELSTEEQAFVEYVKEQGQGDQLAALLDGFAKAQSGKNTLAASAATQAAAQPAGTAAPYTPTLSTESPLRQEKPPLDAKMEAGGDKKKGSKHLLAKIEELVQASKKVGLTPVEKAFIQEIQEMWKDDIMPAIFAAIAEGQAEMDSLFAAIAECEMDESAGTDAIVDLIKAIEDAKEDLGECAVAESDLLEEKEKECSEVVEMKTLFLTQPEAPGSTNEDRLQYLKDMNEYFCGSDTDFKDKMDDCSEALGNYTNTSDTCEKLQNQLESLLCELHSGETGVCMEYAQCRKEALERYEAAKKTVKAMEWETQDEYIAAVRIECMWDAWDLAETPCLVDEEYVEHCYNEPIDLSNLTINYPLVPDAHACTMGLEGSVITHGPADHPCTDEYLDHHYASLDIDDVTLQKMKDECKECPPVPDTTTTTTDPDYPMLAVEGVKCPHFHGDRIFRYTGMTLEACYLNCKSAPGCQHLSYAATGTYAGVCMGCIDGHWVEEAGFNGYDLPPKIAAANLHYIHHDAGDDKTCANPMFQVRGMTTPECYEHCANVPGCLHFSFRSGTCAGCSENVYVDESGYTVYDLTDLGLSAI